MIIWQYRYLKVNKIDKIRLQYNITGQQHSAVSCWALIVRRLREKMIPTLNIYAASHSVPRHDVQCEYGIKCSHISLSQAERAF